MKFWSKLFAQTSVLCVFILVITLTTCTHTKTNGNVVEYQTMEQTRTNSEIRIKELKDQFNQNPTNEIIAYEYAETLFKLGNFSLAQETLRPFLEVEKPYPQIMYLSARIEYVCGNYFGAEILFHSLINNYPDFKEKAETGLMFVYYQTNQYAKAQSLSVVANAITGLGAMIRGFGDREPYRVQWLGTQQAVIPFLILDPLPLIRVEIGGSIYNFLIDTGAGETYLDEALAESLKMEIIATDEGVFAGGHTAVTKYGLLDILKFDDVVIESLPVCLLASSTMEGMSNLYGGEFVVSGIIGTGLFNQFLTTMDYRSEKLIFYPRSGNTQNTRNVSGNSVDLPFIMVGTHLMISKGRINGKEVNVFLDSGLASAESMLLPNATMLHVGIPVPDTEYTESVGGGGVQGNYTSVFNIDSFILGSLPESKNVAGLFGIFPEYYYFNEDNGIFIDALLSHSFLKDYIWTIDFDSMVMTFSN